MTPAERCNRRAGGHIDHARLHVQSKHRCSAQVPHTTRSLHCGIFGTHRRNPARRFVSKQLSRRKSKDFLRSTLARAGAALAIIFGGHHVFRAVVVSIVLTLAAGQNAALLCSVWCHPPESAAGAREHQHQATSPGMTGNDSCTRLVAGATAFVREDVRRGASAPNVQHGVVVPWFEFAPPPAHPMFASRLCQQTPLQVSPLILALRI